MTAEGASEGAEVGASGVKALRLEDEVLTAPTSPSSVGPSLVFLKALHCDLIMDQVLKNLNLDEMKTLTLVSKKMLDVVRNSKRFANTARVIIRDWEVPRGILPKYSYAWKNISIAHCLPSPQLYDPNRSRKLRNRVDNFVGDNFENVASLSLIYYGGSEPVNEDINEFYREILMKTRNLRELIVDDSFINNQLDALLEAHESLRNLEHFIIRNRDSLSTEKSTPLMRNFARISLLPVKLKTLVIPSIMNVGHPSKDFFKSSLYEYHLKVIENSQDSLEELEVHDAVWELEGMKSIHCPNLKKLTLSLKILYQECARPFLSNQPPLEELNIQVSSEYDAYIFNTSLRGRMFKMRKLHIKSLDHHGFWRRTQIVDWTLLEAMINLEEFVIEKPFYCCGPDLIRALPKTVKKISILDFEDDFWQGFQLQYSQGFVNTIGEDLIQFKNLTTLNLLRCFDAIDDSALQAIIKGCTKLKELGFSDCSNVTNYGITGIWSKPEGTENGDVVEREPGLPLNHLKALVQLTIRFCKRITSEGLLTVLRFQYLQSFEYRTPEKEVGKQFISKLKKQNPRLKSHTVRYKEDCRIW